MKVSKAWTSILALFGFDQERDNELTEAQIGKINDELSAKEERLRTLTDQLSEKETTVKAQADELTARVTETGNLKARVSELEAENAKLRARPTETEEREDPSPTGGGTDSRSKAYDEDMKNFKN